MAIQKTIVMIYYNLIPLSSNHIQIDCNYGESSFFLLKESFIVPVLSGSNGTGKYFRSFDHLWQNGEIIKNMKYMSHKET